MLDDVRVIYPKTYSSFEEQQQVLERMAAAPPTLVQRPKEVIREVIIEKERPSNKDLEAVSTIIASLVLLVIVGAIITGIILIIVNINTILTIIVGILIIIGIFSALASK